HRDHLAPPHLRAGCAGQPRAGADQRRGSALLLAAPRAAPPARDRGATGSLRGRSGRHRQRDPARAGGHQPPDQRARRPGDRGEVTMARILIVDDDTSLLKALPEAVRLRLKGVQVDTCDSAPQALDRLRVTDYDAIVADIKMPGMDGLALLAEIRTLRPDTPT